MSAAGSWLWLLYIVGVIGLLIWTRWYAGRPSEDPIVDPDHRDLLGALERLSWPADVDRHLEDVCCQRRCDTPAGSSGLCERHETLTELGLVLWGRAPQ